MYQVWLQSIDIYSSYRPETKIWACLGQITSSKFDEICQLAIPNRSVNAHTKFDENPLCLLKLSSENEIQTDVRRTDGRSNEWVLMWLSRVILIIM